MQLANQKLLIQILSQQRTLLTAQVIDLSCEANKEKVTYLTMLVICSYWEGASQGVEVQVQQKSVNLLGCQERKTVVRYKRQHAAEVVEVCKAKQTLWSFQSLGHSRGRLGEAVDQGIHQLHQTAAVKVDGVVVAGGGIQH